MPRKAYHHYGAEYYRKWGTKRPKYTPLQFHEQDNRCPRCKGRSFVAERPMNPTSNYRSYGYLTKRVQWRIRCSTPNCTEPYCVVLKPEYWDSTGS